MAVGDRLPEASVAADVDPERAVEVADAALDAANRLGHDVRRHPGSVPPRIETKKSAQHVTTRLGPPGGEDPELPPDPPDRSPLCRSLADRVTGSYGIVVGKGLEYYAGFGLARARGHPAHASAMTSWPVSGPMSFAALTSRRIHEWTRRVASASSLVLC